MAENGQKKGMRAMIQRFGSYLSGMIMPNIGAFIAWGLITALFIPDGYFPNEELAKLVDPMIIYLLPLLIGFTGGRLVYGIRGGVVGATATIGVIVGAGIPMFLGAMIMGPLSGYIIKKFDELIEGKVRSGFEMLVNNFSAGIVGAILTILAYKAIGPVVLGLNKILAAGVEAIINAGLLPLANIFIEPAKVLFLNNAINHGILSPIGVEQVQNTGESILFLLEANPGPGLGILLAISIFGKGVSKQTAPGAAIIHFLGGIHEIYFPYILTKPALLLAAIAGGVSGTATFALFDTGLVATASPGSIIALSLMTAKGNYVGMFVGVIIATIVSFLVASLILKASKQEDDEDIQAATEKMESMKGKNSMASETLVNKNVEGPTVETTEQEDDTLTQTDVQKVIFACDAGMGSSAMGASLMKKKFKDAGIAIDVTNAATNNLTEDADIVITHKDLTERAKVKVPNAYHISVDNFLNSPKYDELVEQLKSNS